MCSDRKLGFNWGRILDHVVLVDFEVDLLAMGLVKTKPLFDNPAHGNDRLLINGFCQPEWNFVTFSSDIYYGTIHKVSEFTKCFTWKVMGKILHFCINSIQEWNTELVDLWDVLTGFHMLKRKKYIQLQRFTLEFAYTLTSEKLLVQF